MASNSTPSHPWGANTYTVYPQGEHRMGDVEPATVEYAPAEHVVSRSILTEAQGLVHGRRQAAYGHPRDDFGRTARLAAILLPHVGPLTAADVATLMVCVKLSRQANAHGRDNLVDACGYLETLAMLREGR